MNDLATKADLLELKAELKAELGAMMNALRHELSQELKQHVTATAEQLRIWIGALDDKHSAKVDDLRAGHVALRHDLDAHRGDRTIHRPARRRSSRS